METLFIPVFKIYKEGKTLDGPVTILRKAGEYFPEELKRSFYISLGYTIIEL